MLIVALLFMVGIGLPSASVPPAAPSPPDTTTEHAPPAALLRPSLQFYPSALYAPNSGVGIGVGVKLAPLWHEDAYALLTASPALHDGLYTLTLATHNLDRSRREPPPRFYGALYSAFGINGRQWFYGLGPAVQRENQIKTVHDFWTGELRLGVHLSKDVMIQPHVGLRWDRLRSFQEERPGALAGLTPGSRENLDFALAQEPWGLTYGVRAALDTRDRSELPRHGVLVQGGLERYTGQSSPTLHFNRYHARAYAYFPLPRRSTLALRVQASFADNRSSQPLPFYLLPDPGALVSGVDDFQFYGRHLLATGAELYVPVFNLFELIALEGVFTAYAVSVYDDLFEQFAPRWSFAENFAEDRASYPMRPILGIGARLVSPTKDRVLVTAVLRYTAYGFGIGALSFFHDLRTLAR